jgi:hypothetical protein
MSDFNPEDALNEISKFLQQWFPPEIAPLVVKKQLQATGALMENLSEDDIRLFLSRIQMVILPSFLSPAEARKEIMGLKKKLGMKF